MMKREAGILLPVYSLPGPYGIGTFSAYARQWIDSLAAAGQSYWQILPLGPVGYGDSPYQSFSTFAGNPYLIDLETLCAAGVLTPEECAAANMGPDPARIDYGRLYTRRLPLLRLAYERERTTVVQQAAYREFVRDNRVWLDDYALFMALKNKYHGAPWTQWDPALRLRRDDALKQARHELSDEIQYHIYLQYHFFTQWDALLRYAHGKRIRIIGDLPIYVAMDSADVWANPELFRLTPDAVPEAAAGCPPDGFSASGQLWGNPLYRWEYHKKTRYAWWMERLRFHFRLCDVLRIDHFRGFDAYYAIPYGESDAVNGQWEPGPGLDFFRVMEQTLGKRDVIAEDLGYVTDSVRQLVRDTGFPGMKVFQFAFDSRDTGSAWDYLPHHYPENSAAYTGTHDNATVTGWFAQLLETERQATRDYLCDYYTPDERIYRPFLSAVLRSPARLCVIPLQDWLGLDDAARMNQPSTVGNNWRWRVRSTQLSDTLWNEIAARTRTYDRTPAAETNPSGETVHA